MAIPAMGVDLYVKLTMQRAVCTSINLTEFPLCICIEAHLKVLERQMMKPESSGNCGYSNRKNGLSRFEVDKARDAYNQYLRKTPKP